MPRQRLTSRPLARPTRTRNGGTIRLLVALTIGALLSFAAPATAGAATCANSFTNDGHNGPWRTSANGGTLNGNTVHIQCPGPNVHWQITYRVQGAGSGGVWVNFISFTRSGNGTPAGDLSASVSPFGCDTVNVYRTHVENAVTGGTINKPGGGGGVHLAC